MASVRYRPDIDGLRALSVLAVIAYHFGRFGCSGGFAGATLLDPLLEAALAPP